MQMCDTREEGFFSTNFGAVMLCVSCRLLGFVNGDDWASFGF